MRVNGYFSGFDKILESYTVTIENNVKIEYYNQFLENDINLYYSQYSDSEKKKFEISIVFIWNYFFVNKCKYS